MKPLEGLESICFQMINMGISVNNLRLEASCIFSRNASSLLTLAVS